VPRDWEQYYADPHHLDLTPEPMLVEAAGLLPPGAALDLACGAGRNALHLAQLGWKVVAVDSSANAIRALKERARGLPVEIRRADLERGEFTIAPNSYNLVCDFLYLQRDLFPQLREGVRPGGLFLGSFRLSGTFGLKPGELRAEFPDWKILFYSETDSARIMARKA
jgi:SAM-dependent methyltransferase